VRKINGAKIKDHKLRGEWAEMRFMALAAEHGLMVSKPYGDSATYDLVVEHDGQCMRVQVKSTMYRRSRGLSCQVRGNQQRPYAYNSFDFVAVYLIPEDVWYIVPTDRIAGQLSLFFNPKQKNSKYCQYKEAWHLFKEGKTIPRIQACADEHFLSAAI
jgi:hypothetical protein